MIPRQYGFTFAKALHARLNHPNPTQMLKQFSKQYFMIDQATILKKVFDSCEYPCQASRILPKETLTYSTQTKPSCIGQHFNADVLEDNKQRILVLRENLTSYTDASLIPNQTKQALKDSLISLTSRMKLGDHLTIRVDNHSSLASLRTDKSLEPLGVFLETGLPKNINKNATAEKAIRELREQLVKISPRGGPVDSSTLARAVSFLNDVVQHSGLSARKLLFSRDKTTGSNINLDDQKISDSPYQLRKSSHDSSAKYASRNGKPAAKPSLQVGDLVYVKSDRSKSKARDSYFVTALDNSSHIASLQKFPMSNFRLHPIKVHLENLYLASDDHSPEFPYPSPEDRESFTFNPVPPSSSSTSDLGLKSSCPLGPPKYSPDSDSESDYDLDDVTELYHVPYPTPPYDDEHFEEPNIPVDVAEEFFPVVQVEDDVQEAVNLEHEEAQPESGNDSLELANDVELFELHDEYDPVLEHDDQVQHTDILPTLVLTQPLYGQPDYLVPNDLIVLVKNGYWNKARLVSHTGTRDLSNHSLYWNFDDVDGKWQDGGYLFPGQSWGVLRGADADVDISLANIVVPSIQREDDSLTL